MNHQKLVFTCQVCDTKLPRGYRIPVKHYIVCEECLKKAKVIKP